MQGGRGARHRHLVTHVHSGQVFRFPFVRREQRYRSKERSRERLRGRWIQNNPRMLFHGHTRSRLNGGEGDLELQQDHVAGRENPCERFNVFRQELTVGSSRNGDAVFSCIVDKDQRHARWRAGHPPNQVDVDSLTDKVLERAVAKVVGAECGDEHDGAACARRRDRLVRAFPACGDLKVTTEDRFAARRDTGNSDGHIGVGAADDNDFAHCASG